MKFSDISELTFKLIDKVEKLWNWFFIANLSVAIWIFADDNSMNVYLTIIATILYIAYSIFNCFVIIRTYKFLDLALGELRQNMDDTTVLSKKLRNTLNSLNYNNRIKVVTISYLIAALIILTLLWTDLVS